MTKLRTNLPYFIFIWCREYLPNSAQSNNWKTVQIPESVKLGLISKPRFNPK